MAAHWQEIVTLIIVVVAAIAVGRRMMAQIAAFRRGVSDDPLQEEASACGGCDACGPRKALKQQLVSISLQAPQRIRPGQPHSDRP